MSSKNLTGNSSLVSISEKSKICRHNPCVIWLTGLSGSGKSTVARALEKALWGEGYYNTVLDGDNIRIGINKDLGFSPEDRKENNRRVSEMAKLLAGSGAIVIAALISPFQESRDLARETLEGVNFFEVYIKCSIESCIKRDPKGLYRKVDEGSIKEFTGISSKYEVPINPDVEIDTDELSVDGAVSKIIDCLLAYKVLS